jgi:hypothetical protein
MELFSLGTMNLVHGSGVTEALGAVMFGEHSSIATITIFDETRKG